MRANANVTDRTTEWHEVNWRKANRIVRGLRRRIFKATSEGNWRKQLRYANFTHPNKNNKWKRKRYWGKLHPKRNDRWVFGDKDSGIYMTKFSWTKIERHTMVKLGYSPDNPELSEYWEKRNKKCHRSKAKKLNSIQQKVAFKQRYKCPICGESIFNDEPLPQHHIIPKCKGGKDEVNNLISLHMYCHYKTHYQKE